ncbi:MAG: fibronectin type III domain-containing protein [Chlorobi bacterium]|nr:MAG: Fibronectin type III domain protein [Chlorobi bacterium OLB7]MBK8911766.1 fibronectin type III domain-containing protein [Chlorobiota bacterium]MBX7218121.1 fibronectin type III domain-containing protein [Candidatus Kapabacteria bacterium]
MKLKSFLIGSALLATLVVGGCNENDNPVDPTPDPVAPKAVTNLVAVSLDKSTVGLRWNSPVDTALTGYEVSWKSLDGIDSASITSNDTTETIPNLREGKIYTFTVRTKRGTTLSAAVTRQWAGAQRFSNDAANPAMTIKLYEKASSNGSGLTLDPSLGGPKNVSVAKPTSDVQLGFIVDPAGKVVIGAAYSFPEFKNVDKFDSNTYVSTQSWVATGLNDWFITQSLDTYIPNDDGNLRAFTFEATVSGATGQGFVVRTGGKDNYHYARVFVNNVGGKLLQGTAPNRYVELTISYQNTPNVPFAKRGAESPVGVYSRRLY